MKIPSLSVITSWQLLRLVYTPSGAEGKGLLWAALGTRWLAAKSGPQPAPTPTASSALNQFTPGAAVGRNQQGSCAIRCLRPAKPRLDWLDSILEPGGFGSRPDEKEPQPRTQGKMLDDTASS